MLAADVAKTLVVEGLQGFFAYYGRGMVDIEYEGIAGPHAHKYLYEVTKLSRIDVCEAPEWV